MKCSGLLSIIICGTLYRRIETNAFNNEFLTNACKEWRERLSEGCMLILFSCLHLFIRLNKMPFVLQ